MNSDGIISNKQHLNLSHQAHAVLVDDMRSFQFDSFSGFLNLIFQNYYEFAESSISRSLDRLRQLEEQLNEAGDRVCSEETLNALLRQEAERLQAKANSYPKGSGVKFYLNNENVRILTEEFNHEINWYNGRPMRYFRSTIEEYAEKNRLEREQIIFRKELDALQQCIDQKMLLCIEISEHTYEVRPYRIMPDYDSMYYYLVGISRPKDSGPEGDRIASFRLSRIRRFHSRPKSYRSGRISQKEQEQIEERILNDGVQFLISDRYEVKVRFTARGIERFRNQPHLRPRPLELIETENGAVCTFECTETQIRYYFFQFGAEVEILSPESLRTHFREHYRRAMALYED